VKTRLLLPTLLLAVATGCIRDDSGGVDAPIGGTWHYEAVQTVPASPATTLSGTLEVPNVADGMFTGTLSGTQDVTGGASSPFGGAVTGTSIDASTVDFDAFLTSPTTGRRHVGIITGDSLVGNWVESGGALQGTFRASREP
jgi:hypothetical protein